MTRKQINSAIYFALPEVVRDEEDYRYEQYSTIVDREVTSLSQCTDEEAVLIYYVLKSGADVNDVTNAHFAAFDSNRKQHLAVLSLCRQLGWTSPLEGIKRGVFADAERLGSFINSPKSPVQKPLLLMHREECSKLIHALENILQSKIK